MSLVSKCLILKSFQFRLLWRCNVIVFGYRFLSMQSILQLTFHLIFITSIFVSSRSCQRLHNCEITSVVPNYFNSIFFCIVPVYSIQVVCNVLVIILWYIWNMKQSKHKKQCIRNDKVLAQKLRLWTLIRYYLETFTHFLQATMHAILGKI